MDIYLEQNCPNLLEAIKDCGYTPEDVVLDPFYCVLGLCSERTYNNFVNEYHDEIEAAIEFASTWDIDPKEWDLSTTVKRVEFALMYLAMELENELQYQTA